MPRGGCTAVAPLHPVVTLEALLKCLGMVVLELPKTVSEAEFSVAVER